MKIVRVISLILISLFVVTLTGCNSGASIANNDAKGNSLQNASQLTALQALRLDDVDTPVDYRDSLEDIRVGNFGLKRILVKNNSSDTLYLQLPLNLPANITYDDTRTTCTLNGTQQLPSQGSCLIVFKYLPLFEGESASFNVRLSTVAADKYVLDSNSKNIPYSSKVVTSPQISFATNKITTIGGMRESITLNYIGPIINDPIKVNIFSKGLTLSKNSCDFNNLTRTCTFTAKLERNHSGSFEISATATNFSIAPLSVQANPIGCVLIDDVKTSPYKIPLGFELRQNECVMVADASNQLVSILKLSSSYVPEFTFTPCEIRNDPECKETPIWVPLQGLGFDHYLAEESKNALDICTAQKYYDPKMIGTPDSPTLCFKSLNHEPNKGKASLAEVSTGYSGAELILWDSLTGVPKDTTSNNTLYITTDNDGDPFYLLDEKKQEIWSVNASTINFNLADLSTGKNLCQFYAQWQ